MSSLKSTILHDWAPPIVVRFYRRLKRGRRVEPGKPVVPVATAAPPPVRPANASSPDLLFAGEGNLFLEALETATVYGEYGCGRSTTYVGTTTTLPILAVDSSTEWADKVRGELAGRDNVDVRWVDVGPIGPLGTPLGFSRRDNFRTYIMSPWQRSLQPDVVLVDGRFRVACFLASLLHAAAGATIVFDDYVDRQFYHVVEEVAGKPATYARQALFRVSTDFDRAMAARMLEKFEYVWA